MRSSKALMMLMLALNAPGATNAYRVALPNYRFEFPRDHFNHPEFQTEWWYYTGNVRTAEGRRFGFELTFFRQGADRDSPSESVWDVRDVWMAHLALSDIDGKRFLQTERLNRSGPGIAGADLKQGRVWNGNWSAQWTFDPPSAGGGTQELRAIADHFSFDLSLKSEKPPAINGVDGLSQKAEGEGKASYYISLTRLASTGTINLEGKQFIVEGTSWMDHEFFSHELAPDQKGWDWFSLQLEDKSEIMLYRLRKADGSADAYSAGTYVDPTGRTRHLSSTDFKVTPGKIWTSPSTKARYPIEWTVEVPSLGLKAAVRTPLVQQEIVGSGSGTKYWEGAIDVDATQQNHPLKGVGYLEMTGYAGPIVGLN